MMENPFLAESEYNPVRNGPGEDSPLNPQCNLDELAHSLGNQAALLEECKRYIFIESMRVDFDEKIRQSRIRQIALLTAFYVEYELSGKTGKADAVAKLLRTLEEKTCPDACRELGELLDAYERTPRT